MKVAAADRALLEHRDKSQPPGRIKTGLRCASAESQPHQDDGEPQAGEDGDNDELSSSLHASPEPVMRALPVFIDLGIYLKSLAINREFFAR
jgi:hypothetical protein